MHFDNLAAFFDMGGYALYVWPAFFITWLCFVVLVFLSRREKKNLLSDVLNESARKKRIEQKRQNDEEQESGGFHESKT
ncbi:heme exporter protein CcmD [Alteromonadaceae bacterium M269]|nr:heme exporter protein CcmD [Alteromonadaceae bacterium M269]